MPRGMMVELIGHAGAGKSTLAAFLARELRLSCASLARCARVQPSSWLARRYADALTLASQPTLAARAAELVWQSGGREVRRDLGLMTELLHRTAEARRFSGITDEGPLHALWSLTLELPRLAVAELDALLRLLPPSHVLSLRLSPEEAWRRLQGRSKHRLLTLPEATARRLLERQERVLDRIEAGAGERLIRIDVGPNEAPRVLAERVMALYSTRGWAAS